MDRQIDITYQPKHVAQLYPHHRVADRPNEGDEHEHRGEAHTIR